MSNELRIAGDPNFDSGITVTATLYNPDGTVHTSGIPCPEVGTNAIFVGDMPAAVAGNYLVRYFLSTGDLYGQDCLMWDGSQEVTGNPEVDSVESGETVAEMFRLLRAEALGKLRRSHDTIFFRDRADSKDRITATIDRSGQRLSVLTDPT